MPPTDDPSIKDTARLFRRIHPQWIVYDQNRRMRRPSSRNFNDSQDKTPMSVYVEEIAIQHNQTPSDFLKDEWSHHFLAAITAGWARQCGQKVYPSATKEEPAHADVAGRKPSNTRSRLAQPAEWVIGPSNLNEPLVEENNDE